jgi:hypothetical protein
MSDEYHRASLAHQATVLLHIGNSLAEHGVGDRWEGVARIRCEMALHGLGDQLVAHSRRLEHLSHYAGSHSVMARLG